MPFELISVIISVNLHLKILQTNIKRLNMTNLDWYNWEGVLFHEREMEWLVSVCSYYMCPNTFTLARARTHLFHRTKKTPDYSLEISRCLFCFNGRTEESQCNSMLHSTRHLYIQIFDDNSKGWAIHLLCYRNSDVFLKIVHL